ncbi:hypothetical protein CS0771_23880 [Catellatospora sp. IY07-71]|uniref:hypothetical protein n=1 Tax=Catellatospora sp. IY07-71 TaxID=2728827 RepID=UPI001BB30083|nr:hypothetical protein [Catellatospora sp. IY07-71]BCJ72844.1 hypothetical protein CS0771_23880 [Catellatospora sp. IY07-71]
MQIHSADLVEVTWMWDRAAFRRVAWQERALSNLCYGVAAIVSLALAAWMINTALRQGGTFPYGGVWIALVGAVAAVRVALTGWLWLRNTPDVWYTPLTVRIDAQGVRLLSASSEHFYRWSGLAPVRRTRDDWIFSATGVGLIRVPRALITDVDDAAIAVVVDRYADRVGRPADLPPPAVV